MKTATLRAMSNRTKKQSNINKDNCYAQSVNTATAHTHTHEKGLWPVSLAATDSQKFTTGAREVAQHSRQQKKHLFT